MGTVLEIESAILRLDAQAQAELREWFLSGDGAAWDRQIEEDVRAGRLDALADAALAEMRTGKCTDL